MFGHSLPIIKTKIPGPNSKRLARELRKYECPQITYMDEDFPVFWRKGKGVNIQDVDGNIYIDLTAGFGVANCGYSNPHILKAAHRQLNQLHHGMGDVHPTEVKVQLTQKLSQLTGNKLTGVILSNSGSEAVESAIKTAKIYTGKPGILSFDGAYHGLTLGTLAVTARDDFKKPFIDQISPIGTQVPYPNRYSLNHKFNDTEILDQVFSAIQIKIKKSNKTKRPIGAIIAEPILGRGGIIIPPIGFLKGLKALCREMEILLILDEIYTGFGRTGKMFAYQYDEIIPDILCLGKGMSNGFPISACLGRKEIMDKWGKSSGEAIHTTTFLGNPLGCAMALATIQEIEKKRLFEKSLESGKYIMEKIAHDFSFENKIIGDVRGKGLMIGIEIVNSKTSKMPNREVALSITKRMLKKGIIILPSGDCSNILSITPPLTISKKQIDHFLGILGQCLLDG